jgi:mono/diheme cytochrome c family protein
MAALAGGVSLVCPPALAAHDIPARVTVLAFVRPEGSTLRVVLRVPLEAMRDISFPVRGQGYLDLARAGALLDDAARLWIADAIELQENGRVLRDLRVTATRVSLPSDRSFESYERALAHVTGGSLPMETDLVWQQGLLDMVLEYPIESDRSSFSIRPTLARLAQKTTTVLRYLPPGGGERAYQFSGDPGFVRLDPRWHQTALRFVRLGFLHILDGIDHLLFLLCLVIPFRKLRPLIAIVTSFTVAHSITLGASTLGLAPAALWFAPLIETLIAFSILYMAFENIVGARLERRWMLAFGFGLVHGFGFSFYLRDSLQFGGANLATSLFAFNVGVELGQVMVVAALVPVLGLLFRRVPERIGTILLSAVVAHSAWHWMTERWATLRRYQFEWPALDAALLRDVMRVLTLVLIVGGAAWLMHVIARRLGPRRHLDGIATAAPQPPRAARGGPRDDLRRVLLLVLLVLAVPAAASARQSVADSTRSTRSGVYTADQAVRGKQLYAMHCVSCHTAVTHTGPEFAAKWEGRPFRDLFSYVRESMPKSEPGSLSSREYAAVLAYMLEMNGLPAGPLELPADPDALTSIRINFKPARDSFPVRYR